MSGDFVWDSAKARNAQQKLSAGASELRNHSYVFSDFSGIDPMIADEVQDTYRRCVTTIIRLQESYEESAVHVGDGDLIIAKKEAELRQQAQETVIQPVPQLPLSQGSEPSANIPYSEDYILLRDLQRSQEWWRGGRKGTDLYDPSGCPMRPSK